MALTPGTRLGPHEIQSAIGAGGMWEVYRATDTKRGRQVDIKVLHDAFPQDPQRVARFEREAKTLASLNHPNIAIIHGLERSQGTYALVMELVEGEDLSQRIARGPIPIDEALPIAKQLAEALEAAHEQGIIHRDLKPANNKVKDDGTVKVLDFGLAKLAEAGPTGAGPSPLTMSPTITSPLMTGVGVLLGTAAYMAPEQAKGKPTDKRSDIWAFGCVLYEMLTGQRAFAGEDVTETLAAVVKSEPQWDTLPIDLSPSVRAFLRRSLQKNAKQRLHDMADMRLALEGAFETTVSGSTEPVIRPKPVWRRSVPYVATALAAVLATAIIAWNLWPTSTSPLPARFVYDLPVNQIFRRADRPVMASSADGRRFVYNTTDGTLRTFVRNTRGAPHSRNRARVNVAVLLARWKLGWIFRADRATKAYRPRRRSTGRHLCRDQSIWRELGEGQHGLVRSACRDHAGVGKWWLAAAGRSHKKW